MPRRAGKRRNRRAIYETERYDRAVLYVLQSKLRGKATRGTVIEESAIFLELEDVDEKHRRRTDAARARLVKRGYIYPVELGVEGEWELTPSGWGV